MFVSSWHSFVNDFYCFFSDEICCKVCYPVFSDVHGFNFSLRFDLHNFVNVDDFDEWV